MRHPEWSHPACRGPLRIHGLFLRKALKKVLPCLEIDQRIEICLEKKGDALRLASRILKVSDSEWTIFRPLFEHRPLEIAEDFVTVLIKDHALWRLNCRIVEQAYMYIVLERPTAEGIDRFQRRQFLRVEVALPVCVRMDEGASVPFSGILSELSAGGCRLHCLEEVPPLSPVVLDLRLPDQTFEVSGVVKKKQPMIRDGGAGWEMRIEFEGLAPNHRETLAKAVHRIHLQQIAEKRSARPDARIKGIVGGSE